MAFHFKQPASFQPQYKSAMLYAKVYGQRILHFQSEAQAQSWMEYFRYFRWCCRQSMSTDIELRLIEDHYSIRAKLSRDNTVKLVCKPKRLSILIELNPWIDRLPMETI